MCNRFPFIITSNGKQIKLRNGPCLVEAGHEEVEKPWKSEGVVEKIGDAHDHVRQHGDGLKKKKIGYSKAVKATYLTQK